MSHWKHLAHGLHQAHTADHQGHGKLAGVICIVLGIFLTPMLIGIPLILYGLYKLVK